MKTLRRSVLIGSMAAILAIASALLACSSSSNPPLAGGGAGGGGGTPVDSGLRQDSSTNVVDGGTSADAGELGSIVVVQESSPPCVANGGTTTLVGQEAGANVLGYTRLGKVGTRRFLADFDDGLLQTFDLNGANATAPGSLTGIRFGIDSEGTTIGTGLVTSSSVYYGRFDDNGAAVGAPFVVSNESPDAVALAGSATGSLVVWGYHTYQRLSAVAVNTAGTGASGSSFSFGTGTFNTRVSIAAAYDGEGFGVAWSGDPSTTSPNTTGLYFARVSSTALTGSVVTLTTIPRVLDVVRLVATSSGFALLANGSEDATTYIILLGPDGSITGPAHGFTDQATGWDIAASGSTLGLAATTYGYGDSGNLLTPSFRPLDLTGHPLSGWVCLGPQASYAGVPVDMAIDSDTGGDFSVVLADTSGKTELVQFNSTGTALP